MKTYLIEISIDNEGCGVREKASPGLTLRDVREIISILEEHKFRLLNEVIVRQKEFDIKDKTIQ